ncbi:uncharacterized protein TNCV_5135641 [Trichonephila clavipes]|nr:uncharacterized protein TNCV_5135641 [Trichonephila clavipes]
MNSELSDFQISLICLFFFVIIKTQVESVSVPDGIGNVIEEVVDLPWQINSEEDSDDVQELLDSYNQDLTIDELTEMHDDLERKGKLSVIQWYMEKGMNTADAKFSVCRNAMRLTKKDSSDGYIWECRKKGANVHRIKRSIRKNSRFEESKLTML